MRIREARDDDALDVIELIGGVFGEHHRCILDVDGEMPELRRIASWARELGGTFWVCEEGDRVVACCGATPTIDGRGVELRKLYVHRRSRGSGVGRALYAKVVESARTREAAFIELWSDTKFASGHRFYERNGFVRTGEPRSLGDLSDTREYRYVLALGGSVAKESR